MFYRYHIDDVEDILNSVDELTVSIYYFRTVAEIDDYMKFVIEMLNNSTPEMSMLVHDSKEDKLPDKYEKSFNQLCIDFFIELVRLDSAEEVCSLSEQSGMLGESKVGVHRIAEALQCTMWSNMVRKAPSKPCKEEAKAEIQEEDAEDNIVGPPQEDVVDKQAEDAEEDKDGKQDGEEQNEEKQAATDHVYLGK